MSDNGWMMKWWMNRKAFRRGYSDEVIDRIDHGVFRAENPTADSDEYIPVPYVEYNFPRAQKSYDTGRENARRDLKGIS
jgi:hypothetical protein